MAVAVAVTIIRPTTRVRTASGGGLILIDASSLAGAGILSANGGTPTTNAANDGSGGGGGGGTVVVRTLSAPSTGIRLRAAGGGGGNQVLAGPESEGPGGGGGGGYIRVIAGATFTTAPNISGGANGTSTSNAVTEFPPNGATRGYAGLYQAAAFTFPGAQQCGLDFGDAPAPYPTLLANNGPRHLFPAAALLRVSIGSLIDAETNGQPNATATLDNLTTSDDEDGVAIPALPGGTIRTSVTVQNTTGVQRQPVRLARRCRNRFSERHLRRQRGEVRSGLHGGTYGFAWTVPNTVQITPTCVSA